MRAIVCAVLLGLTPAAAAVPVDSLFATANELLEAGDAHGALAVYESIESEGLTSVALHLNASTAAHRAGARAAAGRHAERAFELEPFNAQVRRHAALVRDEIGQPPPALIERAFRLGRALAWHLPAGILIALVLLFSALASISWMLFLGGSRDSRRMRAAAIGTTVLAGAVLLGSMFLACADRRPAAVVTTEMTLRSAPGLAGPAGDDVGEGALVRVIHEQGDWRRVVTADRRRGWLEVEALDLVRR